MNQEVELVVPTEQKQVVASTTSVKVQNKIYTFIEKSSQYFDRRSEFVELNKKYRNLSKSKKPVDSTQVVEKVYTDALGHEVKVQQLVKRKIFPDPSTEALYTDLRKKRKEILRFHKHAILYINTLTEKIIQDFIGSCEPLSVGKKTQEKTFGWKQFNKQKFTQSFSYSLIQSSKYFNDFIAVKQLIGQLSADKEIMRLKQNLTKAESTTVQQDLQRYKFLKTKQPELSVEDIQAQIDEEFGTQWSKYLGDIYSVLEHLQSDDEYAKFLFNNVKNVTRVYQEKKLSDDDEKKVKISNGFKNMIAKIIREMLVVLSYKIQVYLDGMNNHQIKLQDVKKIIKIWASLDSTDDLKLQFSDFDGIVEQKLHDIETMKATSKLENASKTDTTTTDNTVTVTVTA